MIKNFFIRTTFINLEMNGKELRRLSLHLFAENESGETPEEERNKTGTGKPEGEEEQEAVAKLEDQLVKTITSEADLMDCHKEILQLAQSITEAHSERKMSLLHQVELL